MAQLGSSGELAADSRRSELSQGRFKVIVEQRQLMTAFDDAEEWSKDHDTAALEDIEFPNTDDLQQVCKVGIVQMQQ